MTAADAPVPAPGLRRTGPATPDPRPRAPRLLLAGLLAVWLLAPAALAAARWPRWWTWIASEQTPMTWLQSVVLVLCAAAAVLVAHALRLTGGARRRTWLLLAAGFGALAVDERFALHERVRDGVLAPRGVTVPLPWVAPGDFLVLGIGVAGLLALPLVWRAVRDDPASRTALLLGVGLAVVAVGLDSVDPSTWTVQAERVQQSGEEVIELGSGLALLAAVVLRLLTLLAPLQVRPEVGAAPAPGVGAEPRPVAPGTGTDDVPTAVPVQPSRT